MTIFAFTILIGLCTTSQGMQLLGNGKDAIIDIDVINNAAIVPQEMVYSVVRGLSRALNEISSALEEGIAQTGTSSSLLIRKMFQPMQKQSKHNDQQKSTVPKTPSTQNFQTPEASSPRNMPRSLDEDDTKEKSKHSKHEQHEPKSLDVDPEVKPTEKSAETREVTPADGGTEAAETTTKQAAQETTEKTAELAPKSLGAETTQASNAPATPTVSHHPKRKTSPTKASEVHADKNEEETT